MDVGQLPPSGIRTSLLAPLRELARQRVRTLDAPVGPSGDIRYAAWHPDGRRIVLAWMTSLGLWDVETGRQLALFEGHEGMMVDPAFTETGEWLA